MPELRDTLLLERWLAGELPAAERAQVDRRLAAEPGLREALRALQDDDARTLAAHPPREVAEEIGRRLRSARAEDGFRARARRTRLLWILPAPLAAAAALLFVVARPPAAPPADEPEVTRTKGLEPRLHVFLKQAGAPVLLRDGARVHPRDEVQVATVLPARLWAAVVSIDAQRGATLHAAPAPVEPGEVRLPRAFELDEAPGFERFFLVVSQSQFPAAAVLDAARALAQDPAAARTAPLPLPAGLSQSSLLLEKVLP